MPVYYNSKALIPAPLVQISREAVRAGGNNEILGYTYNIVLTGSLLAYKGSPASVEKSGSSWSGQWWINSGHPPDESIPSNERLKALLRKQMAVRKLFETEGKTLEVTPIDGSVPLKCNPRVLSINFEEGVWTDRSPYTINLQADKLSLIGDDEGLVPGSGSAQYIADFSEDWSIELNEDQQLDGTTSLTPKQTFRVTHKVYAAGKLSYNEVGALVDGLYPWQHAKRFVTQRLGFDASILFDTNGGTGAIGLTSSYLPYDYARSETIVETDGEYGVTESWVLLSGSGIATETCSISTKTNLENARTTVVIEGSIKGLRTSLGDQSSAYTNALTKFNSISGYLFNRAQVYSGITLNPSPLTSSVGRSINDAVITYIYEYDNRPSNCIPGALAESITIVDNHPGDVIARIPIPGRSFGPILQNVATKTERTRVLTVEAVIDVSSITTCNPTTALTYRPNITALINNAAPVGSQVYKEQDQESWNYKDGRYNRNITWVWEA